MFPGNNWIFKQPCFNITYHW